MEKFKIEECKNAKIFDKLDGVMTLEMNSGDSDVAINSYVKSILDIPEKLSEDNEQYDESTPRVISVLSEALKRFIKEQGFEDKIEKSKIYTLSNITYDKNINDNYEYQIIRECICDGTLMFMEDLMLEELQLLSNQETCFKLTTPQNTNMVAGINYTIGDFKIDSEYGDFGTKEKPWLHSKFRVSLPVKCDYILKENENDEMRTLNIIGWNK
jgi:hypothetical protein